MKSYITWVADDGEEFTTREECEAYERRYEKYEAILRNKNDIEFYSDGKLITDIKFDDDCDFINKCDLMVVKTGDATRALAEVAARVGFTEMPRYIGIYFYNTKACSRWERITPSLLKNLFAIPYETIKAMLN